MSEEFPGSNKPEVPEPMEHDQPHEVRQVPGNDGRVADVEKAWDMAHAGKGDRDRAVVSRERATDIEAGLSQLPDAVAELREPAEQLVGITRSRQELSSSTEKGSQAYQQSEAEINERDSKIWEQIDSIIEAKFAKFESRVYEIVESIREDKDFDEVTQRVEGRMSSDLYQANVAAEQADKDAERIEEWAGILHDHPLSEAYKERFGLDAAITPKNLVEVEHEIAMEEQRGRANRNRIHLYVEPLDIKLKRTFLEDIRTGRAAQWQ